MRAMPVAAAAAFIACLLALFVLLSEALRSRVLDQPNARSLHARPVPRTGGVAILAGLALSAIWLPDESLPLLWIALALGAASFADDLTGLHPGLRLLMHLAAGACALWQLGLAEPGALSLVLLLAVGWMTNLYNFMDGSDGLAGGMAVAGFGAYAAGAHAAGLSGLAELSLALAAANAAFLLFNFHPARVFMGDAGSIPLGFLAGALGVAGWHAGAWPLWFPALAFAPFVADASLTLAKRLLRGEKVWQAHREHYYQRLVRMGLGHRRTALAEYALMAACAGAALGARNAPAAVQTGTVAAAVLVLAALAIWIDRRWSAHPQAGA